MSNADIIATIIALCTSAITITLLLVENARLKRAIRMRERYSRLRDHDISDWSR